MSELSNIEKKRHTLAHLLAAAVLKDYPHAKLTLGPAIDTGFYYDIDFSGGEAPGDDDLKSIQKTMKKTLSSWKEFTHRVVSKDEALALYQGNPYKTELINEIADKGESITLYICGDFTDLCRGGHVDSPATDITADSFKLDKIAGAYWRGDENNAMLTRIYGLAFDSKEELEAYETQIEEAKKRDHRKLGKELGLFTFSDLVGPGLPLWTPKGTILRQEIDGYVQKLRKQKGYQHVTIPHIAKKSLYETSGHWNKYSEDLFKVRAKEGEDGEEYVLKPMNCPHHTQIFDATPRSYRDMPQRFAETTMVYRNEQSGELAGLTRVLSITQDDAHVFCRENQLRDEIEAVWDIVDQFYGAFGFNDMQVRLSYHDPKEPEKYLGDPALWEETEAMMKEIAESRQADYFIGVGEAAFYAPKLDFMAKDSIGRTHQVATIQLDRLMPERFDLTCINEQGEKERIVMIHCAIAGSLERFAAVLIEHVGGNFPLWLAPEQVRVIPVADTHQEYATNVYEELRAVGIRAELDDSNESMGKKIRSAKTEKLPYFVVVGDKEVADKKVTLEKRNGMSAELALDKVGNHLLAEIETKLLD